MQNALKNPHFKKIWETIIMNRHPSEETLIDALLIEADYDGCLFIEDGYIGMPAVFSNDCGYVYAFNFCSDYDYDNNRKISFYDYKEHKRYNVKTGVLEEKYTEEILKKERVLQHILGRPITLEDVLILCKKYCDGILSLVVNDDGYATILNSEKNLYIRVQLKKHLHEQTPETWERISNLI